MSYRLFVSEERTVLVWIYENGDVAVALRPDPDATWGPPIPMVEEKV